MDTISKRIKEERAKLGISQQQLAFDTGLSVGGIQSLEIGRAKPNVETLSKLAERFDISTDYLIGKTDVRKWIFPTIEEYIQHLKDSLKNYTNEDDKKRTLDMIEAIEKFHKDIE